MEKNDKKELMKDSLPKVNLAVSIGEGSQHASAVARPGEIAMAVSISTGTGSAPQVHKSQDDQGKVIDMFSRKGKEKENTPEEKTNL